MKSTKEELEAEALEALEMWLSSYKSEQEDGEGPGNAKMHVGGPLMYLPDATEKILKDLAQLTNPQSGVKE